MKKDHVRLAEIRKHIKRVDDVLQGVSSQQEQPSIENFETFLKQTKSLLNVCISHIKTCQGYEDKLAANSQRLKMLNNILQFKAQDLEIFLDYALDQAIQLTESEIGYVYSYDEESRYFNLIAWSKEVVGGCATQDPLTVYQLEQTGAWGEAVRQRKPIVINQLDQTQPEEIGFPEGCAPLEKFMAVPIISDKKIVAVVGMANKKADYEAEDLVQLTHLMEMVWKVVEQRRAVQSQQVSEDRFRRLAENAVDLIYRYEFVPERGFTYVSPAAEAITGYSPEEHYRDPDLGFKLVHPDDRQLLESVTEGRDINKPLTLRWVKKDGSIIWCEQRNVPIRDEQGTLIAIEGIARDISAERRAEQQYLQLFNLMLHGIAVHEMIYDEAHTPIDYRFLRVNPAFEKLTNLDSAEILGRTAREVLPNLELFWIEIYGKVVESGTPIHFVSYSRELGKHFEVTAFKTNPDQFATIVADVTDRFISENDLRKSEEKYRLLVENQKDLIVKVDAEGRFLYVSPSYCRLFGKTEAELLGESFIPKIHQDDLALTLEAMENLKNPPHTGYIEQRALTQNGWRWLAWSHTAVLNQDGEIQEIIGLGIDITENKQMAQALAESERKFRIALKNSPVVVFEQDRDLRYTWIHNAHSAFDSIDVIGKIDADLFSDQDAAQLVQIKGKVLESGQGTRQVVKITIDGKRYYHDLTVEPVFDNEGSVTAITCSSVDITELKLAEKELRQLKDYLEGQVEEKTRELTKRVAELERFYEATIEREFRMKELRDTIAQLKSQIESN